VMLLLLSVLFFSDNVGTPVQQRSNHAQLVLQGMVRAKVQILVSIDQRFSTGGHDPRDLHRGL